MTTKAVASCLYKKEGRYKRADSYTEKMNTIPIPPWLTVGQTGASLYSGLDCFFSGFGRQINPYTFFSPGSNVSFFNGSGRGNNYNRGGTGGADLNNVPARNAMLLANGTSSKYACRRGSPFGADFASMRREQKISTEYYWEACTPPVIALVVTFALLHMLIMVGAVNYYVRDTPDLCAQIIGGRLIQWRHALELGSSRAVVVAPPVVGPTIIPVTAAIGSVVAPPIADTSSWWEDLFASVGTGPQIPIETVPIATERVTRVVSKDVITVNAISAQRYTHYCPLADIASTYCSNKWSVPSQTQLRLDPSSALRRYANCKPVCRLPARGDITVVGIPSSISWGFGICTCSV